MFCPNCGSEIKDGASFCPQCGSQLASRVASQPMQPAAAPGTAKRRGVPIAVIAVACAVVLVGILGVVLVRSRLNAQADGMPPTTIETQGDEGGSDDGGALTEESANRISPKESIEVTNLVLKEDAVKRYVLTGTVTNKSSETYNVGLKFAASKHSSDKYGEETVDETSLYIEGITPYTTSGSNTLTVYNLAPGSRDFTVYPNWSSLEEYLDNPTCTVDNVWLPDSQESWRYDTEEGIEILESRYTQDGKVEISFKNNTGLYLEETRVWLLAYNDGDLPAVADNYGARPTGVVTDTASVSTLKPGDEGTFECYIGEGFKKIEVLDTTITPDRSKNSFN